MKNHRGAGIVFVLVILMILFLFILSFLLLFAAWEKHSFLTLAGNEASRFTKTGVEEALWQVDHNPRESDGLTDAWRTAFAGTDVDNNEDGMPDSRWITVNNSRGGISGRYAVLVEDENGAVNINAAGNAGGSFNEGHTVAEIGLLPELCGKSGAASIASFRYGADGAPGKRLVDDDGNAERLGKDRVDNDGDGWIDEGDEGLDDPGEFVQEGPAGDDRPYFSPSDVKLAAGIGQETFRRLRPFIAPWSYDLNETRDGTRRINLNTAPYETLFRLLRDLGYEERQAAQIACNICDYRDDDDIPTVQEIKGAKVIGLEKTPYLNEIDAVAPWEETITPAGIPAIEEKGGQFIELFNPYAESLDISGWKLTGLLAVDAQNWGSIFSSCKTILDDLNNGDTVINPDTVKDILSKIVPVSVTIPDKQTIKPRSFYTIGDTVRIMIVLPPDGVPVLLFLPDKTPPKCDHYAAILAMNPGGPGRLFDVLRLIPWIKTKNLDFTLRLYDKENHLIEEAHYPFDTPVTTTQKNDPRMTGTGNWFPFSPTPGARNIVFQPWIGGEFDPVTGLVSGRPPLPSRTDRSRPSGSFPASTGWNTGARSISGREGMSENSSTASPWRNDRNTRRSDASTSTPHRRPS